MRNLLNWMLVLGLLTGSTVFAAECCCKPACCDGSCDMGCCK